MCAAHPLHADAVAAAAAAGTPMPTPVPKLLHQTWKDESIPEKWRAASDACKALHPDYVYKVCVRVCVFACVCVRQREREGVRGSVCVLVQRVKGLEPHQPRPPERAACLHHRPAAVTRARTPGLHHTPYGGHRMAYDVWIVWGS
jgi:hypothetical protein